MKQLICLFLLTSLAVRAQDKDAKALEGMWIPGSGKAIVKIEEENGKFNGKIIWLKTPLDEQGKPKVDKNNPDAVLKTKPLIGLSLLKGFSYAGDKVWKDGTIYDPENGKTYSCKITMVDENTLDVRGFIGVTLIGRTDQWKKAGKQN